MVENAGSGYMEKNNKSVTISVFEEAGSREEALREESRLRSL